MKYLFTELNNILNILKNKNIFLFLDYDGTLVSIKDTPEKAKMSGSVRKVLKILTQKKKIKIGIISGRELKDLKKMVGIKNIICAGNHGFKISYLNKIIYTKRIKKNIYLKLKGLKSKIKNELCDEKGILFEDKKEIFSVHYRLVNIKRQAIIIKKIKRLIKKYKKFYSLKYGKKVIEIFPAIDINKGKAIKWILKKFNNKRNFYPVYIGDDMTDEDAFSVLKKNGLTVCVGNKRTIAEYFLKNTKEVINFLKIIRGFYE